MEACSTCYPLPRAPRPSYPTALRGVRALPSDEPAEDSTGFDRDDASLLFPGR